MFLDVHWRWAPRFERAEPSTYWGPALGERKTFGAQSWKEPLVTRGSEGCSSRLHQGRNFTAPSWRWPLIHVSDCVWLLHFIVCFFFPPTHFSMKAPSTIFDLALKSFEKHSVFMHVAFSEWGQPPEVCLCFQASPPSRKALSDTGDFENAFLSARIWVDFFFFPSSFLMVFSKGSKWHWSVKVDSKIYNVFVVADCQQNWPLPAVLYADSENQ